MKNFVLRSGCAWALSVTFFGFSCNKKPAEIMCSNMKDHTYVSSAKVDRAREKLEKEKKEYRELFPECKGGITKNPGVVLETILGRKLGAPTVLLQVINQKNGSVAHKRNLDANPDMEDLSLPYNFDAKGDFLINFVVKDEIVAQGRIKYE